MTLSEFFRVHPQAALGFSGGVDSAYLLYASRVCKADVRPYFVKTAFQPAFELADAQCLCRELGIPLHIVQTDILSVPGVADNPPRRCYYCKQALFSALRQQAMADGYPVLLDGTNASDDLTDRPGMQALQELEVLSPLRLCGLTKDEIRRRSREAGLFTWEKPAYACLATRIPTGQRVTGDVLRRVEGAEDALRHLGFTDFRVRVYHGAARLQLPAGQLTSAVTQRHDIRRALAPYFEEILLDLKERST